MVSDLNQEQGNISALGWEYFKNVDFAGSIINTNKRNISALGWAYFQIVDFTVSIINTFLGNISALGWKQFREVDLAISLIDTSRISYLVYWRQFDHITTDTAVAILVERSKGAGQWISI